VLDFYDRGEIPSVKKQIFALKHKMGYQGSSSYKKTNDGRKFLMERSDIVAARLTFLRTMHQIRVSGDKRPVFHLDETWVNQNHTLKYIWQDSASNGGLSVPVGKVSRLTVRHVGSALTGFIPESKWVFRSQSTKDYHEEMTAVTFKYWFLNRFINCLEEGSIIIMDNASYHSVTLNKVPNTSAKKQDIIDWLEQKQIQFSKTETRAELLKRVLPCRHDTKTYDLDQLANESRHQVIRLPPYHWRYNRIELV
jgi:hypothetical protein